MVVMLNPHRCPDGAKTTSAGGQLDQVRHLIRLEHGRIKTELLYTRLHHDLVMLPSRSQHINIHVRHECTLVVQIVNLAASNRLQ